MPSAPANPTPSEDTARQLLAQGMERLRFGDMEGAQGLFAQAIALDSGLAQAHYQLGNCQRRLGRAAEAETSFKAAMTQDPSLIPAWFGLSFLYREHGRTEEAIRNLQALSLRFPADREVQHKVGGLFGEFGEYALAAVLYEQILESEPQARNHQRLGQYYQRLGRNPEAAAACTQAIGLNPDSGAAYLILSNTRRYTRSDADTLLVQSFNAVLQRKDLKRATQICLHFALGKMQDDRGAYDDAFRHFEQGNRLRRSEHVFETRDWLEFARQIGALTPSNPSDMGMGNKQVASPIFIVGMLRSGATLIERLLSGDPEVGSLGEVAWLDELVGRITENTGVPYPTFMPELSAKQIAEMRTVYTEHWPLGIRNKRYVVDKNPLNFRYLGLIARMFPDARIVHCRRDPRDTAVSMYFQNFASPHNAYAYDLKDIGHFYQGYISIMDHWHQTLPPGMFYEMQYEDLVTDLEAETRKLLAFLMLPWDENCLKFLAQKADITAAQQTHPPLYEHAVGRWRNYEAHLGPLLDVLGSR